MYQKLSTLCPVLLPYVWHKDSRRFLILTCLVTLISVGATTYLPFVSKNMVEALGHEHVAALPLYALFCLVAQYACLSIVSKTACFLQDLLFFPVINVTIRELNLRLIRHLHRIPLFEHQALSVPDILSYQKRMGLAIRFFMRALLISVLPTLLRLVLAFAVIWHLNVMREFLILGIISLGILFFKTSEWYLKTRAKSWDITDRVTNAVGDSMRATMLVRFCPRTEEERLHQLIHEEARAWFHTTRRMDMMQMAMGGWIGIMMAALIGCAAYKVHQGILTLGDLLLLKGQLIALFTPIKQTLIDIRQIFESSIDIEKVVHILNMPTEKRDSISHIAASNSAPAIVIDAMSYAHTPSAEPLIHDLSLIIQHGEKVILKGPSGCGKSTLLNLMTGLVLPDRGNVTILGANSRTIHPSALGTHLHFVPQTPQLFQGTLYENIVFGTENVDLEIFDRVLKDVCVAHIIKHAPQGLETRIGDGGLALSGGEKQRIVLARALLKAPQILIMDEALSALSADMERSIFKSICERVPTLICVSHNEIHHDKSVRIVHLHSNRAKDITSHLAAAS